jgi:hypothetical protein
MHPVHQLFPGIQNNSRWFLNGIASKKLEVRCSNSNPVYDCGYWTGPVQSAT